MENEDPKDQYGEEFKIQYKKKLEELAKQKMVKGVIWFNDDDKDKFVFGIGYREFHFYNQ